jgi:hypothetical protein
MSRKSARNQPLSPNEAIYLNSLALEDQISRAYHLYQAGWTLQAIGDALIPPRPRSTVRAWLLRFMLPEERDLTDAPTEVPLPVDKSYKSRKKPSPGILPDELDLIKSLAPLARQYRAKMPSTAAATAANDQLTAICLRLHASGVKIKELADAAEVTYRAMYKRVKLTR